MKLIVYHGSNSIINTPNHDVGRKFKDFGVGFYITTNIKIAKSCATRKLNKPSFINKYTLSTEGLNSLTFDLDINWILFIAYNRGLIDNENLKEILASKYSNLESYDVIIGPIADDKMFDTMNMFFENSITLDHCIQCLNSMDLDIQYNLKTSKAIKSLIFINSLELNIIDKEYYSKEIQLKKNIMEEKMNLIRRQYRNKGKYFEEFINDDLIE